MGKQDPKLGNGLNGDDSDDETPDGVVIKKLTKEEKEKIKRALKKKQKKQKKKNQTNEEPVDQDEILRKELLKKDAKIVAEESAGETKTSTAADSNRMEEESIEVELVEQDEYLLTGKYYEEFKHVFQHFATPKQGTLARREDSDESDQEGDKQMKPEGTEDAEKPSAEQPLSRKKKKQQKLLKVAQLKALVKRPDLVEVIFLKKRAVYFY